MNNKNIPLLIVGILLIIVSLSAIQENYSLIQGIFLGMGASLIGLSIARSFINYWYNKYPTKLKNYNIEQNDERNIMIRDNARAKSGEITQWLIITVAFLAIIFDLPLWLIITLVLVFTIKSVMEVILMSKYDKQL